jgi:hypothetical protein
MFRINKPLNKRFSVRKLSRRREKMFYRRDNQYGRYRSIVVPFPNFIEGLLALLKRK